MKLISCPVCARQVSDSAAACPQCGHLINAGKTPRVIDANVAGKAVTALGIWVAIPWIARTVAAIGAVIVAIVLFSR